MQAPPLAMSVRFGREKAFAFIQLDFNSNAVTPLKNAVFASGDACNERPLRDFIGFELRTGFRLTSQKKQAETSRINSFQPVFI